MRDPGKYERVGRTEDRKRAEIPYRVRERTVADLQFLDFRGSPTIGEAVTRHGDDPMTGDAEDAQIAENLQRLPRELLQRAVRHVELLERPVHPEETVLLDQSQRGVDEPQNSDIQGIKRRPVKTRFERNTNENTECNCGASTKRAGRCNFVSRHAS